MLLMSLFLLVSSWNPLGLNLSRHKKNFTIAGTLGRGHELPRGQKR